MADTPPMPDDYYPTLLVTAIDGDLQLAFAVLRASMVDPTEQLTTGVEALRKAMWEAKHNPLAFPLGQSIS